MQLTHDVPSRLARLLFTYLMAMAWCGAVKFLATEAAAQPATAAAPGASGDDATREKSLAVLRRLCDFGKEVVHNPDANPADIPVRAAALGNDPAKIFDFVRTQVAYEPYRGILRGGRGALASMAGNALDKSLLLKALLEAGGHPCRLVRGKLPPDKAEVLVRQFLAADPLKGPLGVFGAADTPADDVPAEFARRSGLDEQKLKEYLQRSRRRSDALLAEAWKLADAQTNYLSAQLDKAKVALGRGGD